MNGNVLVLGATGGIGGELARQLKAAGFGLRALKRPGSQVPKSLQDLQWLEGDCMNAADVARAAHGCEIIVHAVNPPGYQRWSELVLPMMDNTIAAACAEGATIVLPGTVYNFGPDAFPLLREQSPQRPLTRKGAIRVEMERRLESASRRGARVLIVRAGDFFGPGSANSWFAQGFIQPGRPVRTVRSPAAAGVGHQWSYLPDVGRTIVELLARRHELDAFARFHTAGHYDADGTKMAAAIQRIAERAGQRRVNVRPFPWWLVTLLSPFVTVFKELREMRYLWRESVRMDNTRLLAMLGHEPHTPLDAAVEATLRALKCLPESPPAPACSGAPA